MFTTIKNKIIANKENLLKIVIFLWAYFLLSDFAFADTGNNATAAATSAAKDMKSTIIEFSQYIATALWMILGLMTYLTTVFLSPEWTSGSLFGMTGKIKEIWILISNVVYLIFAFILIFIAFMNILWKWWDWEVKQALPRFIVWILIVPFSWFIVQFLVAMSSVLTIASLNLPFDTFSDYKQWVEKMAIPTNCKIDFSALTKTTWTNSASSSNNIFECNKDLWLKELKEIFKSPNSSDSIFWVVSIYTHKIVWIDALDKIGKADINQTSNTWDIIVKFIFDILFVLVYGILMVALWLVLMMRWIRLWIFMMLSPLFWLLHFFKWKLNDDFFKKFNLKSFIGLAMVPVYTMLALSFWLLFIYTVSHGMVINWSNNNTAWNTQNTLKVDKNKIEIWNWFNLEIVWSFPAQSEFFAAADWALWVVWNLILKVLWIVVLWWVVTAALKSDEITKGIVEPIIKFGDGIWSTVASLPQYAPIIPGWQSFKSLEQIPGILQGHLANEASQQSDKARSFMWIDKSDFQDLANELKDVAGKGKDWEYTKYKELLEKAGWRGFNKLQNDAWFKDAMENMAKNTNVKLEMWNAEQLNKTLAEMNKAFKGKASWYDVGLENIDNIRTKINSWISVSTPAPNPAAQPQTSILQINTIWSLNGTKDISAITRIVEQAMKNTNSQKVNKNDLTNWLNQELANMSAQDRQNTISKVLSSLWSKVQ